MSRAATEVLRIMAEGTEFSYENGVGYLRYRRVKKASAILAELLRAMAIRRISTPGCETEYYRIGPEGRALIA